VFICPFLCFVEPYSEKNLKMLIDEFNNSVMSLSTAVTPTSNASRSIYSIKDKNKIHRSNRDKQVTVDLLDSTTNESLRASKSPTVELDIGTATDLMEKIGTKNFNTK